MTTSPHDYPAPLPALRDVVAEIRHYQPDSAPVPVIVPLEWKKRGPMRNLAALRDYLRYVQNDLGYVIESVTVRIGGPDGTVIPFNFRAGLPAH